MHVVNWNYNDAQTYWNKVDTLPLSWCENWYKGKRITTLYSSLLFDCDIGGENFASFLASLHTSRRSKKLAHLKKIQKSWQLSYV